MKLQSLRALVLGFLCLLIATLGRSQLVGFTSVDTVCVNVPVSLTNTSTGGSTYYWTFCVSDINATPIGTNMGNLGGLLSEPAFIDYAYDNGTYYGYLVNNYPGGLIQLNFGNSLLNTPVATSLGNLGGNLYLSEEGIQLVQQNGNWYGIIVGGTPISGGVPSIVTVNFGPSLGNTSPTSTNWGNVGGLAYPAALRLINQGGHWYGFTVNSANSTITRFDFGTSFNNAPTGVNLGNLGGLSTPTGMSIIQSAGNWYMFLVNQSSSTITRLDFGNSLLNTPTATNLGNPGNALKQPRDLTLAQYCGSLVGFLVNYTDNALVRITFPNGPTSTTVTGVDLGNLGGMSFPQSISKVFQQGPDLYTFVTNVTNNTVTRFEFNGCDNSTIPASSAFTPPPVNYTTPGLYHISLQMDIGLPSQQQFCKTVMVLPPPTFSLPADTSSCIGLQLQLSVPGYPGGVFQWNTGSDSSSTFANTTGKYWVSLNNYGCQASDTVNVAVGTTPTIKLPVDTMFCDSGSLSYASTMAAATYQWNTGASTPAILIKTSGKYKLTLSDSGCVASDSTLVSIVNTPKFSLPADTSSCIGLQLQLSVPGYPGGIFQWSTGSDSSSTIADTAGNYWVSVNNQGCQATDTVKVAVHIIPTIKLPVDTMICDSGALSYTSAMATATYQWNTGASTPSILVKNSGLYKLTLADSGCVASDSTQVSIGSTPKFSLPADTSTCTGLQFTLGVAGYPSGVFQWSTGSDSSSTIADTAGKYWVNINNQGCQASDTVKVAVHITPTIKLPVDTMLCDSGSLSYTSAMATATYQWNTGASTPSILVKSSGLYKLTLADSGCVAIDSTQVSVVNTPTFSLPADTSTCTGLQLQLSVSGYPIGVFQWSTGSDSSSTIADTAGKYWVSVNSQGCQASDTVKVAVHITPTITLPADTMICDSGLLSYTSAMATATFQWNTGANTPSILVKSTGQYKLSVTDSGCVAIDSTQVSIVNTPTFSLPADTSSCTGLQLQLSVPGYPVGVFQWSTGSDSSSTIADTAGKYWVSVNNQGCQASDTVKVTVYTTPTIKLPVDTMFCDSGSLSYTSAMASATYQWNNGASTTAILVKSSGQYKLTLADSGCVASDSTQVSIVNTPSIYLPADTSFCGSGNLGYPGALAGVTYTWNTGSTATSINVTANGLYSLQLNNQGCIASASSNVMINTLPFAALGKDTTVCETNLYTLSPGPEPPGYTYTYIWQDGTNLPSYLLPGPGSYTVLVTSNAGCTAFDSIFVSTTPSPHFTLGKSQVICPGEIIYLHPDQDTLSYVWQNGTKDTVLPVNAPGTYSVTGTNGCGFYTDSVSIVAGACVVHVPSAFTPNGDGINDIFRALGVDGTSEFNLSIYNRWGQLVYQTTDKLAGWDGTLHGIPQPVGAYVYELKFKYELTGQSYVYGGTVTLIR